MGNTAPPQTSPVAAGICAVLFILILAIAMTNGHPLKSAAAAPSMEQKK